MPDNIERTIYKLDLDDSDYIRGVDRAVNSTQKFSAAQEEANKRLQQNRENLRLVTSDIVKAKSDLDAYTGSNEKYRAQLAKQVDELKKQQSLFTDEVKRNQKAYDDATLAAQRYNSAAAQTPTALPSPSTGPVSGGILPTGSAGATLQSMVDKLQNLTQEDLVNFLANVSDDMETFRQATEAANEELETLGRTGGLTAEETRLLSESVHEANLIIDEYDSLTKNAGSSTLSYRSQITALTKELQVLTEAGKENTEEFIEKEKQLIHVTRAYKDQKEQVRILASETRGLDFGRAAITTATTAFQGYTAVSILAGGATEELQKKTFQLFAVMQLITSLEQLHNQLKAVSVLRTNAQSAAQAIYTNVVGASTGALKAFRLALLGVGVGAAIVGIGFLIAKYIEFKKSTEEAREAQEDLRNVNEEAIKSFTDEVVHVNLIRTKLNDLTVSQKERIALAKEYNKTAEEGNKIDLTQINNIDLVNEAIDRQIAKIEQRARARAAESLIVKAQEDVFIQEENARIRAEEAVATFKDPNAFTPGEEDQRPASRLAIDQTTGKIITRTATQAEIIADRVSALMATDPKLKKAKDRLQRVLKNLGSFITTDTLISPDFGKEAPENVFLREQAALQQRLEKLRIDALVGEEKILADGEQRLKIELARLKKLREEGKLTDNQLTILQTGAVQQNTIEVERELENFRKAIAKKEKEISDELIELGRKNAEERLNLIQDEFDRRRQLIEFNEQKEVDIAKKAQADKLEELDLQKGLIDVQLYYTARAKITEEGEQELNNITIKYAQQRSQLSQDIFLKSLGEFDRAIADSKLINDKAQLEEIRHLVDLFSVGAITYEDYRKKLSAIQEKYDRLQLVKQVDTLQQELRVLRRELNNELDTTSKHYDDLIKLIKQKEQELVNAQKNLETTGTGGGDDSQKKVETIEDYARAIGQLMDNVVQFWKTTNEAEAAALDRSIALQERRVTEAQKIAERGNATYLRMEEDRLKELQIAKENAARRQLAIDAALQASQLLVGVTGAIADLAKGPGGIARTIADVAIIVGALASGYALVRSLQANQPKFATGTKSVKRTGEPAGTDTIPAWLTEGEAVITKEKNKAYHPVIEAIHDGTVPADFLNQQVKKYHQLKSAPEVNYNRVKEATELHITANGKLSYIMQEQNRKIDENNDLQRQTLNAMKNMSVSAKIDRDGVAIAVHEYMEKLRIAKNT